MNLLNNDKPNKNEKDEDKENEIHLTVESSTLDRVHFYIYHLKSLLKTSDEQHITTVTDFDDALLQFSSFINNGKSVWI